MAKSYEEDVTTLNKLLEEWDKDSVIDRTQPEKSSADNMSHHAKYLRIHARNKLNIEEADQEYKDMKRLRSAHYDGTLLPEELKARGWNVYLGKSPKTITQREELLETDPLLMEILKRKKVYETIVQAAEFILKEINSRHYSIKAYMEWEMKIRNG